MLQEFSLTGHQTVLLCMFVATFAKAADMIPEIYPRRITKYGQWKLAFLLFILKYCFSAAWLTVSFGTSRASGTSLTLLVSCYIFNTTFECLFIWMLRLKISVILTEKYKRNIVLALSSFVIIARVMLSGIPLLVYTFTTPYFDSKAVDLLKKDHALGAVKLISISGDLLYIVYLAFAEFFFAYTLMSASIDRKYLTGHIHDKSSQENEDPFRNREGEISKRKGIKEIPKLAVETEESRSNGAILALFDNNYAIYFAILFVVLDVIVICLSFADTIDYTIAVALNGLITVYFSSFCDIIDKKSMLR